jgi:hypothetical protein
MVDKIMAVRRDRCGAPVGRVDDAALGRLLAFMVGVADWSRTAFTRCRRRRAKPDGR